MRRKVSQRGQIVLLVILLGLLGLTIGLAALSRALSDIKQTAQTDSGTKALAAAEAGVEYAIANVATLTATSCSNPQIIYTLGGVAIPGVASVRYYTCPLSQPFAEYKNLNTNDVMTVDLTAVGGSARNLYLLWKNSGSIEVSVLYNVSGTYSLRRYAFNASGFNPSNNFTSGVSGITSNCVRTTGSPLCTTPDSNYNNNSSSCNGNPNSSSNPICLSDNCSGTPNAVKVRIRRLYTDGDVAVCAFTPGPSASTVDMGIRYDAFVATATTTDGTVKRVQKVRTSSGLPGIFDYTIYTEGSLTK